VTYPAEVLAAAMAEASRDTFRLPPPYMFGSSLRPSAPLEPPATSTTGIVRTPAHEAPVAVAAAPEAPATKFDVGPVWQALLDVRVWRSRRWWRLAASLVVKRLKD
jgi:hypothetical protein